MAYTTISGGLTDHTIWTAGTYYLSAHCPLGNYNLTLDAENGDIIIKTAGDRYINLDGSGNIASDNTDATHGIYFTSKNDDSLGETISGSTGTPAKGDQSERYISINGSGCDVSIYHAEFHYAETTNGVMIWHAAADQPTNDIVLHYIKLKNCGLKASLANPISLIGQGVTDKAVGNVSINDVSIDNTNSILDSEKGHAIKITPLDFNFCNNFINPTGTALAGVYAVIDTANNVLLQNNFVALKTKSDRYAVLLYKDTAGASIFNIRHNIITSYTADGLKIERNAGTLTVTLYNNIFIDNSTVGKSGIKISGTMTLTDSHNGFYNNNINASGFIPTNPIYANPVLSDLYSGTVIASTCAFPNGYAVRNEADYERQGIGVISYFNIDEELYSWNGLQYNKYDLATPGTYYEVDFSAYSLAKHEYTLRKLFVPKSLLSPFVGGGILVP